MDKRGMDVIGSSSIDDAGFSGQLEPKLHRSSYRDAANVASPPYSQLLGVPTCTFPTDGMAGARASAFFAADGDSDFDNALEYDGEATGLTHLGS
jgi:hypothetical protein